MKRWPWRAVAIVGALHELSRAQLLAIEEKTVQRQTVGKLRSRMPETETSLCGSIEFSSGTSHSTSSNTTNGHTAHCTSEIDSPVK